MLAGLVAALAVSAGLALAAAGLAAGLVAAAAVAGAFGFMGEAAGLAAALAAAGALAGAAGCPATVWLAGALGLPLAGAWPKANPVTNIIAAIVCVAFMVILDYFFAGVPAGAGAPGLAGAAGCADGSWLKNVVARQLATTLSPGAYEYCDFTPASVGLRTEATFRFPILMIRSSLPTRSKKFRSE